MYHVQREFLRERTRCKALEEELENPMNIHRWRRLEVGPLTVAYCTHCPVSLVLGPATPFVACSTMLVQKSGTFHHVTIK